MRSTRSRHTMPGESTRFAWHVHLKTIVDAHELLRKGSTIHADGTFACTEDIAHEVRLKTCRAPCFHIPGYFAHAGFYITRLVVEHMQPQNEYIVGFGVPMGAPKRKAEEQLRVDSSRPTCTQRMEIDDINRCFAVIYDYACRHVESGEYGAWESRMNQIARHQNVAVWWAQYVPLLLHVDGLMRSFRRNADPCYHGRDYAHTEHDFCRMEQTLSAFNCDMQAVISEQRPDFDVVNGFKFAVRQYLSGQNIFP